MWFDVGKIKKAFPDHSDHISVGIMKQIPELMNNPIAITEYKGADDTINNTASYVAIEKDTASISKADLLTTSAPENDRIFITTILQNALAVKYNQMITDSGRVSKNENGLKSKDDTIYDDDFEQAWWDSVAGTLET